MCLVLIKLFTPYSLDFISAGPFMLPSIRLPDLIFVLLFR